jgi:hypothetical protein
VGFRGPQRQFGCIFGDKKISSYLDSISGVSSSWSSCDTDYANKHPPPLVTRVVWNYWLWSLECGTEEDNETSADSGELLTIQSKLLYARSLIGRTWFVDHMLQNYLDSYMLDQKHLSGPLVVLLIVTPPAV